MSQVRWAIRKELLSESTLAGIKAWADKIKTYGSYLVVVSDRDIMPEGAKIVKSGFKAVKYCHEKGVAKLRKKLGFFRNLNPFNKREYLEIEFEFKGRNFFENDNYIFLIS